MIFAEIRSYDTESLESIPVVYPKQTAQNHEMLSQLIRKHWNFQKQDVARIELL